MLRFNAWLTTHTLYQLSGNPPPHLWPTVIDMYSARPGLFVFSFNAADTLNPRYTETSERAVRIAASGSGGGRGSRTSPGEGEMALAHMFHRGRPTWSFFPCFTLRRFTLLLHSLHACAGRTFVTMSRLAVEFKLLLWLWCCVTSDAAIVKAGSPFHKWDREHIKQDIDWEKWNKNPLRCCFVSANCLFALWLFWNNVTQSIVEFSRELAL